MITKELIDRIARHEGFSTKAYRDSLGYWTIGYGHLLSSDKSLDLSDTCWAPEQCREALEKDVDEAYQQAVNTPEWQWLDTHDRQGVWVEMCFNLGWDKLKKFVGTRTAIRHQQWAIAKQRMLNSLWAKQVKGRANTLADIMESGYENA